MHRSGTSALTRIFSLLGYALPNNVTGSSLGNETGHWESALISQINDYIFEQLGLVWFSWSPIKLERLNTKLKMQIIDDFSDKLGAEFSSSSDFVLKDPRICRTAPLLLKAAHNADISPKIIISVRNPLEVADSLSVRDNISKEQSALIWLRYILDAELASRNYPRVILFYDELLDSTEKTLQHIFETLKITPPTKLTDAQKEIERFLNRKMKHHTYYRDDVVLDSVMRGWVSQAFFALAKLRDIPDDKETLQTLDEIRQSFDEASPIFETVLNQSFAEQQEKINLKTAEAQEAQKTITELNHSFKIKSQEIVEKFQEIVELKETHKYR